MTTTLCKEHEWVGQLPQLEKGDKIKLYGRETTVVGFDVSWNDGLMPPKYEIILLTIGRGDPFERSLDVIELYDKKSKQFKPSQKPIDFHIKDNLKVISDNEWEDIWKEFCKSNIRGSEVTLFNWLQENFLAPEKKNV